MAGVVNDLLYALRVLRSRPAFAVVAILTITLGVSANTAVFSIVNAVLLKPLPFDDPGRLMVVGDHRVDQPETMRTMSLPELDDYASRTHTVEAFGAWRDWGYVRSDVVTPESIRAAIATPGLFAVLRTRPVLGRVFRSDEDQPGANGVVLIGEGYWRDRFGSDPAVLGRPMTLSRAPFGNRVFTIVGVLPKAFEGPMFGRPDVWALSSTDEDFRLGRDVRNRRVFARLRPGIEKEDADRELKQILAQMTARYPEAHTGWSVRVVPLLDWVVGPTRGPVIAFLVAVGLVLLIACANLAALMLARTTSRRREFAIRRAIGAGRAQIARIVVAESLIVSVVSCALALVAGMWLLDALVALGPRLPRADELSLDWRVVLFTAMTASLSGVLFGTAPALLGARVDPARVLAEESGTTSSGSTLRLRRVFVAAEVALCLMLLVSAALATRLFVRTVSLDPGFDARDLMVFQVYPSFDRYSGPPQVAALYDRISDALRAVPGVRGVGAVSAGPLFGGQEPVKLQVEDTPAQPDAPTARYFDTDTGYFRAMGIRLVRGREFTDADRAGTPRVAIINETMARRFWPGRQPVGARVRLLPDGPALTVVGVVADTPKALSPGTVVEPEIYWPYRQSPRWAIYFVVRGTGVSVASINTVLQGIDRDLVARNAASMASLIEAESRGPRFLTLVFGLFAGAGLLMSVVGVYGLVAFSVAQRTREIGIRISIGASGRDILLLVLSSGLVAVLAGIGSGLAGLFALARVLRSLLPQLGQLDAVPVAVAATTLGVVALAACFAPARRAMRIDPIAALRYGK
jgi:predicted permease